jgi:hypothetical protein
MIKRLGDFMPVYPAIPSIPASSLGWPSTDAELRALRQQVADLKALLAVERARNAAPVGEETAVEWLPERPGVRR